MPQSVIRPGTQVQLVPNTESPQREAVAVIEGGYVVTWESYQNGDGYKVYSQRFDNAGAALSSAVPVSGPTGDQYAPAITAIEGGYIVAWQQHTPNAIGNDIYLQRYNTAGIPQGDAVLVNTTTDVEQGNIAVAAIDGGYVVTWQSYHDGDSSGIYAQRYNNSGEAQGDETLVNTTTASQQIEPAIAAIDGGYVVTWQTFKLDTYTHAIYAQRYDNDGVAQGGEVQASADDNSYYHLHPAVTAIDGGYVIVSSRNYGLEVQRFNDAGEKQGDPLAFGYSYTSQVKVTALADGGFMVSAPSYDYYNGGSQPVSLVSFFNASGALLAENISIQGSFGASPVTLPDGSILMVSRGDGIVARVIEQPQPFDSVMDNRTEIVIGTDDDDMFLAAPGSLGAGDQVLGKNGNNEIRLTDAGTLNLTAAKLQNINRVTGSDGDDTFIVSDQNGYGWQVNEIDGGGGTDTLQLTDRTSYLYWHNLTSIEKVTVAAGRNVVYVHGFDQAKLIDASNADVTVISNQKMSFSQRSELFANGIDTIRNADGTMYVSDGSAFYTQPSQIVNTTTQYEQNGPAIAKIDGGFVVTWMSYNQETGENPGSGIYAQRYNDAGVKQGDEVHVNTTTLNYQAAPAIAGIEGGYVIAWQSNAQDGSGYGIYAQRYNEAGEAQGGEVQVNTTTSYEQYNPQIVAIDGGYVIAWEDSYNYGGMFAQRYNNDGVAQGDEVQVSSADGDVYNPKLTAIDGGYLFSWYAESGPQNTDIYTQLYDNSGVAQGGRTVVNTTTAGYQGDPVVAAVAGGYVVAWVSSGQDGWGAGVYLQRYNSAGVAQGGETLVNTETFNEQRQPAVAAIDGGFVVAWNSYGQDGSGGGIYAQRYNDLGVAQGGETLVNTSTVGDQYYPIISALDGGYLISWYSYGGYHYGTLSQRFNNDGEFQGTETYSGYFSNPAVLALPGNGYAYLSVSADGSDNGIRLSINTPIETRALTPGADTIDNPDVPVELVTAPANMDAADNLAANPDFSNSIEMTTAGTLDLTAPATFSGFQTIFGSEGDDTFVVSQARLADVTTIHGGGGQDTVTTSETALDLIRGGGVPLPGVAAMASGAPISLDSIEKIVSTNAAGTAFKLFYLPNELRLFGTGAADSVSVEWQVFNNERVHQLLADGIETIHDAFGTYTKISGAAANQAVNDNATVNPFSSMVIDDPDGQTLTMTLTVTITNGAHRGDFTTASTAGWTRSTSGNDIIYTKVLPGQGGGGGPRAPEEEGGGDEGPSVGELMQTAVRALIFDPRENAISPNTTETTSFTVSVAVENFGSESIAKAAAEAEGDTVTISDSSTSVVTTSVNDAPTAVNDTMSATSGSVSTVSAATLLFNDRDVDLGDTLTLDSVSGTGSAGTVTLSSGTVTYNPGTAFSYLRPGQTATDTFSYTARDAAGATSVGTVTVTVNGAPQTAPVITSFSPDTGVVGDNLTSSHSLVLTGTSAASGLVSIYDRGSLIGAVRADGNGGWSYQTGTLTDGSHSFVARSSQGDSSALVVGIQPTTTNHAPVITVSDRTVGGISVAASTLFSYSDADGNAATKYELWDSTAAATSGYWAVNGTVQNANTTVAVSASQLAGATFQVGKGSDLLWVRGYDGQDWSEWKSFTLTQPSAGATPNNHAPTISVSNVNATRGQSLSVASLYTASDVDNDTITKVQFWDSTGAADSGVFYVNGVAQPQNNSIEVATSNLASASFKAGSGTDQVWARAYDGSLWSDWKSFTITAPVNIAPVVSAASVSVSKNALLSAASLFSVTDANNDAMTGYELWDSTAAAGSGYWTVNGVTQTANQAIAISAADLADTKFQAGIGTDSLWVRATDGLSFSDWKNLSVTAANRVPVISASDTTLAAGSVAASSLFSITDGDNDTITSYQLYDNTTAANSGFFAVNGVTQAANSTITLTASQLASTTFEVGKGSDLLWFRASDGTAWSEWKSITVTEPSPGAGQNNHAPTIAVANLNAAHGQVYTGSHLATAADVDGDTITRVEFWDSTASSSSGHFVLNGQETPANTAVGISGSQINNITFQTGSGADQLWARAYDGNLWSDWKSFTVTAPLNHAPVAAASNQTYGVNQTVAARNLFSVSDADGDQMVKYQFWDDSGVAGTGYFTVGGVAQGSGQNIDVLASSLDAAAFVTRATTGATESLWVRANDGQDWSAWKQFFVTTAAA